MEPEDKEEAEEEEQAARQTERGGDRPPPGRAGRIEGRGRTGGCCAGWRCGAAARKRARSCAAARSRCSTCSCGAAGRQPLLLQLPCSGFLSRAFRGGEQNRAHDDPVRRLHETRQRAHHAGDDVARVHDQTPRVGFRFILGRWISRRIRVFVGFRHC